MEKEKSLQSAKTGKLLFYISLVAFPVVQFIIFYIIVNFNSLSLAFKEYTVTANGVLEYEFVGFKNLGDTYVKLFTDEFYITCIKNSLIFYGISILGGTVFSLSFSYYIYKQGFLGNFFKIMLYLPHILSAMVLTVMYKYLCQYGLPEVGKLIGINIPGFRENLDWQFTLLLFYNLLMSFGNNMLIYTGTMAGISDAVIEAAEIDGANSWQEFIHVIMPSIFSTFALFIVTGMIQIFNGQGNLFNFFGLEAPERFQTFGYYIYVQVKNAGINYVKYPPIASLGLCLTSIAIPIIFTGRHLLNKYGPSED